MNSNALRKTMNVQLEFGGGALEGLGRGATREVGSHESDDGRLERCDVELLYHFSFLCSVISISALRMSLERERTIKLPRKRETEFGLDARPGPSERSTLIQQNSRASSDPI